MDVDKYPPHLNVDFRKLDKITLTGILKYYNVEYKENARQTDLAVTVAKIFEAIPIVENDVVDRIASEFCHAAADSSGVSLLSKRNFRRNSFGLDLREQMDPAVPGEQVAAKVSKSGEDGSWILGNILDFDLQNQTYLVQDEDDVNRIMTLSFADVRRLDDVSTHLRRGDSVLAVFPETTSFYKAIVSKTPRAPSGGFNNGNMEVIIKFEDDEDESGKNPARRVPARFVLLRRDLDENEESDEED